MGHPASGEVAARARDFNHEVQRVACDVFEPWPHSTVVRATRYPDYWAFNLVRVEEDPEMSAQELAAFADEALDGLPHRRIDFERAAAAEQLRPDFEELGWLTQRLVWMRHEAPPPPVPEIAVEEVPYEAVHDLRVAWHYEEFRTWTSATSPPRRATSPRAWTRRSWPSGTAGERWPIPRSTASGARLRSLRSMSVPATAAAASGPP